MSAKYFHINNGLRGAYMPDNGHTVEVHSQAGLHAHLEGEARYLQETYMGANKRAVARLASEAWAMPSMAVYPAVMPLRPHGAKGYSYGLFVTPASREEYLEAERES